jgi:hypothetical protein
MVFSPLQDIADFPLTPPYHHPLFTSSYPSILHPSPYRAEPADGLQLLHTSSNTSVHHHHPPLTHTFSALLAA